MYKDYRIVIVTPAGRRVYLELLIHQILKLREIVDEYRLWINTKNQNDIDYMYTMKSMYPNFITCEELTVPYNNIYSICSFFKNCRDTNTIYIRFDDDIIQIDTIDAFKSFLDFRIKNPQYFLVHANILNNPILTHLHERFGNFDFKEKRVDYYALGNGWNDVNIGESVHRQILATSLDIFRFSSKWILNRSERIGINCFSWFGEEFNKFNGDVGVEEEEWLTVTKPNQSNFKSCIFGEFVCVHYAYYTQREHLDKTNILECYKIRVLKE